MNTLRKYKIYGSKIDFFFNFSSTNDNKYYISNLTIAGPLGILQKSFIKENFWINWNFKKKLGFSFKVLWNSMSSLDNLVTSIVIMEKRKKIFFSDLEKLILGVTYGWFSKFSIFGRGFSFRSIKRYNKFFLKFKVGYSHFVYFELSDFFWIKISKKKNKLFIFSLDFWKLQELKIKIRSLRSKHTYKIQGITFFKEKIKVKPGKEKQV